MGYYTRYELKVMAPEGEEVYFTDQITGLDDALDAENSSSYGPLSMMNEWGPCTWYTHEEEMARFSLLFPSLLFALMGEGEDPGDLWVKYFKNGCCQVCKAEITFPPFNPDELLKWV